MCLIQHFGSSTKVSPLWRQAFLRASSHSNEEISDEDPQLAQADSRALKTKLAVDETNGTAPLFLLICLKTRNVGRRKLKTVLFLRFDLIALIGLKLTSSSFRASKYGSKKLLGMNFFEVRGQKQKFASACFDKMLVRVCVCVCTSTCVCV